MEWSRRDPVDKRFSGEVTSGGLFEQINSGFWQFSEDLVEFSTVAMAVGNAADGAR